MTFHNANIILEDNKIPIKTFAKIKEGDYSPSEIIDRWLVPTASVVFKNIKIKWPSFAYNAVHGDILLFLLLAEKGKLYAFKGVWSTYRKNINSITNSNRLNTEYIKKVLNQIENMNNFFSKKYQCAFNKQIGYWKFALFASLKKKKKYHLYLIEILKFSLLHPAITFRKILK
jgi:hypothetical protein